MATLAQLRTRVRSYLDAPDPLDSFWSDTELNNWINQAYYFSYMELVQAYEGYFAQQTYYNIVSGTDTYALPADFSKFRLLERVVDNTATIPLIEFERIETANLLSTFTATNIFLPTFRFFGNNFILEPLPQVSITNGLRLEYVPIPTQLTLDADTPAASYLEHWQELIVLKAVISAKLKEEMTGGGGTDMGPFQSMLESWEQKVKDAVAKRAQTRVYTTQFGLDETTSFYYP